MKSLTCQLLFCPILMKAQIARTINDMVTRSEVESHIRFLASDAMRGRGNNSPEIEIAAEYIATRFRVYGTEPANGESYFQEVELMKTTPPASGSLSIEDEILQQGVDMLGIEGFGFTRTGNGFYEPGIEICCSRFHRGYHSGAIRSFEHSREQAGNPVEDGSVSRRSGACIGG